MATIASCTVVDRLLSGAVNRREEEVGSTPIVCAIGVGILVVGGLVLALMVWFPAIVPPKVSASAVALPLLPALVAALGMAVLSIGLRGRSTAFLWLGRALAVGIVATCITAMVVGEAGLGGALLLARPVGDGVLTSLALRADLWLLLGALSVGVSSIARGALVDALNATLLFAGVTLAYVFVLIYGLLGDIDLVMIGQLAMTVTNYSIATPLLYSRAFTVPLSVSALLAPALPVLGALVYVLSPSGQEWPVLVVGSMGVLLTGVVVATSVREAGKNRLELQRLKADALEASRIHGILERVGSFGAWRFDPVSGRIEGSLSLGIVVGSDLNKIDDVKRLFRQGDHDEIERWFDEVSRTNGVHSLTKRTVEGSPRWLEFTAQRSFIEGNGDEVWGVVRDVTDGRGRLEKTERDLALIRAVASKVPDVDFVYDLKSRTYTYSSRPIGSLLGRPDESGGTTLEDSVLPDDADLLLAHIQRVNRAHEDAICEVDFRAVHADGRTVCLRSRACVFERDSNSNPVQVFGTCQDVTKEWEARTLLAEAQARFERVCAKSPGAIYQFKIDASGEVSFPYFSPSVSDLLGIDAETIREHPDRAFALVHPEDHPGLMHRIEESRTTLADFGWIGRLVRPDGRTAWLQAASRPTRLEDGSTLWDGIAVDVTATKEALRQLEETQRRLDVLLSESRTVIYSCLPKSPYSLERVAPNVRFVLGYIPEQVAGRPLFAGTFVHEDDEPALRAHEKRFVDHGHSRAEYRLRALSGDYVWVRDDVRIVDRPNGAADVVGAWTDISEQRALSDRWHEQELRYQTLAAQLDGMVVELVLHEDARPEFLFVSQGSYALVGVAPEEIRMRPEAFLRLIDIDDRPRLYRELLRSQSELTDVAWEGRCSTASGNLALEFSARPWHDRSGAVTWIGVFSKAQGQKVPDVVKDEVTSERTHALIEDASPSRPHDRIRKEPQRVLIIASGQGVERLGLDRKASFAGFEMTVANSAGLGLELAKRHRPGAIVIVDDLPDAQASWVIEAIRSDDDLARVPTIVMESQARQLDRGRLMRTGATAVLAIDGPGSALSEAVRNALGTG